MGRSKDLATGTFTNGLTVDTSDQVIINHSGDAGGLRIDSTNNTNTGSIRFGDVADNYIGAVEYNHSTNALSFYANNATRMTIDTSGYITMPNQPKFRVRRNSSSLTLTGNNAKQDLIFNVKDFDVGSGYNTTTGKYTVPATGLYFFFLNPRFDGISSSTYARGLIYKGASVPSSPWSDYENVLSSIEGNGHSTDYGTMNVSGIFNCTAGDTIHFLGGGNVDASITLQAESQAGGFMIG